jgi:hypothetical protein
VAWGPHVSCPLPFSTGRPGNRSHPRPPNHQLPPMAISVGCNRLAGYHGRPAPPLSAASGHRQREILVCFLNCTCHCLALLSHSHVAPRHSAPPSQLLSLLTTVSTVLRPVSCVILGESSTVAPGGPPLMSVAIGENSSSSIAIVHHSQATVPLPQAPRWSVETPQPVHCCR